MSVAIDQSRPGEVWMGIAEVCAYIGRSRNTVKAMLLDGRLPSYKDDEVGKTSKRWVARSDVDAYIRGLGSPQHCPRCGQLNRGAAAAS